MFDKVSLKRKIYSSSFVTLGILIAIGVSSHHGVNTLAESINWVDHTHKVIKKAMQIEAAVVDMETGMRGFLLAGKDEFLDPFNSGGKRFSTLVTDLKQTVSDNPPQVELLGKIETNINEWKKNVALKNIEFRRAVGTQNTMDQMASLIAKAEGKTFIDRFRSQIKTFSGKEEVLLVKRWSDSQASAEWTKSTIINGVVLAIILSLILSMLLARSIIRPFSNIFRGLKDFSSAELGRIGEVFETIIESLSTCSKKVSDEAEKISNISGSLSEMSNKQSASVEDTSASAEQISAMVKKNVALAQDSRLEAENMGKGVKDLSEAMAEIEESNLKMEQLVKIISEIGEKTKIIDEIVLQTKLLSFNASVESERAGEHGRGFAVVAQEVGKLAQLSGQAAFDIGSIVKKSICEGSEIAAENSSRVTRGIQILSEVKTGASKVERSSTEIFNASSDQSKGVNEIARAIENISGSTQKTVSISTTAAGASDSLNSETVTMNDFFGQLNELLKGKAA